MPRTLTTVLLLGWTAGLSMAGGPPKADEMLRRVFARNFSKAFVQVAVINNSETAGIPMTMRIDSALGGWMRYTCIQPASMANIVSIDDGRNWTQYEPERGTYMKVPSTRSNTLSLNDRIKLITRNYELTASIGARIAGTATFRIDAEPMDQDLPQRVFWVEQQTFAPLRYIVEGDDTPRKVLLDTLKFEFKAVSKTGSPPRPDGKAWKLESMEQPVPMRSVDEGIRRLKMAVRFPKVLPYGFRVQNVQLIGTETAKMLSVRMTDGLAYASLFIGHSSKRTPIGSGGDHVVGLSSRGINYQLKSDLPPGVAQDLLESILDANEE